MATRIQRQLQNLKQIYPWISTPLVVGAPMRVFAGPALATAVSRAGGIGFMGPGAKPSQLDSALSEASRLLDSHASDISSQRASRPGDLVDKLPVGVGFQTFDADLGVALLAVQKFRPVAVWLFAPRDGQKELDLWSEKIRHASPGTQIWIQVGSVRDAVLAANSAAPPDVLVLQGIDAGGHGLARGAGIISLLPEAADALKDIDIPLVAAGGISDGRGLAAALAVGAVGAAMGTRFLGSEEANIAKGYQRDVLRISDGGQNTVRTTLYDALAGRTDWPAAFDGRNIINKSITDQISGISFEKNKELYAEALQLGDDGWGPDGRLTEYVGSAVGLVRTVATADSIVKNTRNEAVAALSSATGLL